jgi:hypothetical protein
MQTTSPPVPGALICNDMWADPQCSISDHADAASATMLTHVLAWQMSVRVIVQGSSFPSAVVYIAL